MVRLIGIEPTHLAVPDPKSGASTNFATGAWLHFLTVRQGDQVEVGAASRLPERVIHRSLLDDAG